VLAPIAAVVGAGCAKPSPNDMGAASVTVQALRNSDVASVTVTVVGSALPVPLLVPLVRYGNQFSALAGNLPVGNDYTFAASAIDSSTPPVELYHGSVTNQVIQKNTTANIIINMNQVAPGVGYSDQGPLLDSISVSSFTASYGDTVALKAAAHDPDAGETALLAFTWTASCGSVGGSTVIPGTDATPSVVNAIFTAANVDGSCVISLTVTDPHGISNVASFTIAVAGASATGNAKVTANLDTYPVIVAMTADPAQIVPGGTTSLSVIATDADGDALTYAWSTPCPGSFSAANSSTTDFALSASAGNQSCDFQVVVTDGNFPDGRPKGGVITNHLGLTVKPIMVTVPPRIDVSYQSRTGFATGAVVDLAVAATDPSGGNLSYVWTSSFGSAPVAASLVSMGLDPSQWTAGATWTAAGMPSDGASVVLTVTATSSATGLQASSQFRLVPGPIITAIGANLTRFTSDAMTALLSVSAVGAQGDVLMYAWSSSCPGTFSAADQAFSTFTLAASPTASSCEFGVKVTDVDFADGPASGGQISGHLTIAVLDCSQANVNACGGCGALSGAPGSSCGACGSYLCSADKSAVSCSDPGLNACGGCGSLSQVPGAICGACGSYLCSADRASVSCFDPGLNACGGCGALSNPPNSACGTCGTYLCSADKSAVSCSDPGANACGGCGVLSHPPGAACGVCGSYACSVDHTSVSCSDPGLNACGGCAILSHAPGAACGICGAYLCSADKNAVSCSDPGLNACGGCGTLSNPPGAACGACGTYVCNAGRTAVSCSDPGLNACGGCGTLSHPPGSSCGVRGQYDCTANKSSVVCVDCALDFHDGGDGVCRSTGTCSAGYHSDGTGACVASGCATGYVISGGECSPTFTSLSAGTSHVCGVKTGNTIACWGLNSTGQSTAPVGTFTSVGAGQYHGCAVKGDGTLACWGSDTYKQISNMPGGTFTSLSAGYYHACGVRSDGTLACWGQNAYLQASPPSGTFTSVAADSNNTCGVKTDGTVVCWGSNASGESSPRTSPYAAVSAGATHTCQIKIDGSLACWGWGTTNYGESTPPAGTFTSVSVGVSHTCGVSGGTLACWGAGGSNTGVQPQYGQALPPSGNTFVSVSAGDYHNCALKTDGTVACWGLNTSNQAPASPPAGPFASLSAGGSHTCGVKTNGSVLCWGSGTYGQTTVPTGTTFASVTAGANHTCGVKADSTVACWGLNSSGQAPTTPPPSGNFISVSAGSGSNYTCGVKTSGSIACWGLNTPYGQARPPSGSFDVVSTAQNHSCALSAGGILRCWGYYWNAP
jgi:alpha-tubulin suppressor-like RCC1 family protein